MTETAANAAAVLDEIERAIVGKRPVIELVLAAMLGGGHVLLEDVPGVAKTLLASSLAQVTDLSFARIQFTPDLAPADITGSAIFDQRTQDFEFRPGPIFTNVLLADEVNRAPAKTQAALLEAMGERQVTTDGRTRQLAEPFLVIATQNPIDFDGTYPLPEAQLDRFLARIVMGYPSIDNEVEILQRRVDRGTATTMLTQVVDSERLLAMRAAVEQVHVDPSVLRYVAGLVHATRESNRVELGSSPRGSLAVVQLSRAVSAICGRTFVIPDDVKRVAVAALGHRILVKPEQWVQGVSGDDVVNECLDVVAAPAPIDYSAEPG